MLAKKFITMMIFMVALMVVSSNSFAQNMPGDKAGRVSDMLYKKLNLSTDQYSKVYTSLLGYYSSQSSEMKGHKSKEVVNSGDWKTANNSITSILNKEQNAVYSGISEKNILSAANRRNYKKTVKAPETSTTESKKDMTKTVPPTTPNTTKDATKKSEDKIKNDVKKNSDKK